MSWQAHVVCKRTNETLTLTVWGRDIKTAERNAEARAALALRADPSALEVVSLHQLSPRRTQA